MGYLEVTFTSDSTKQYQDYRHTSGKFTGFAAMWQSTESSHVTCIGRCACSPSSGTTTGNITDGYNGYNGYDGYNLAWETAHGQPRTMLYKPNMNCQWIISSTGSIAQFLHFMDIELMSDFVTISRCSGRCPWRYIINKRTHLSFAGFSPTRYHRDVAGAGAAGQYCDCIPGPAPRCGPQHRGGDCSCPLSEISCRARPRRARPHVAGAGIDGQGPNIPDCSSWGTA